MCVCELVATKDAIIAEKVVLDKDNTNLKARVDELVEAANSSISQCNADDGKLAFDTCRCGELLAATDSDCSTLNEDISKIIQNNPCGLFRALMAAQVALQDRIVFLEPFTGLQEINDQKETVIADLSVQVCSTECAVTYKENAEGYFDECKNEIRPRFWLFRLAPLRASRSFMIRSRSNLVGMSKTTITS